MVSTHYYKKYGIMCCIVLKYYYLCVRNPDLVIKRGAGSNSFSFHPGFKKYSHE